MKLNRWMIGAVAMGAAVFTLMPVAEAGSPKGRVPVVGGHSVRGLSGGGIDAGRALQRASAHSRGARIDGRAIGEAISRGAGRGGSGDYPLLRELGAGRGDFPLLRELGNALNDRYGYGYGPYGYGRHNPYNEMADAYRDVGIAHAVVNAIGIFANAAIASNATQVVATAPVATQHVQPAGHWETRRVLVQEGYYQQEKVYIEPRYDQRTGKLIGGGFYETRTTWVPEVYRDEQVWVQHQ